MRFIHAGDLHLGNTFKGLGTVPAWLQNKLQTATETAFSRLIDDAIESEVDFVVFPGDIYDTNLLNPRITWLFSTQMERLNQAQIPVYLSFGNHDFRADLAAVRQQLPANVTVFDTQVTTVNLITAQQEKVAISGFSYGQRHLNLSQVAAFPTRQGEDFHIGLYHGALGVDQAGDYAPFSLTGLQDLHYDYWALGHIHVRQTLQAQPFIGYSGNLQGLNPKEQGEKGYYLVTANAKKQLVPEFTPVAPIVWTTSRLTIPTGLSVLKTTQYIREQLLGGVDEFQLLELEVTTDDVTVQQLILNGQLQQQLSQSSQTSDNFYIYAVELAQNEKNVEMPILPAEAWTDTMAEVFSTTQLQKLGLNLIDDFEVFEYFMQPETMAILQAKAQLQIQVARQGGFDYAD
ncbi:MAG: DNA repair exonuclease [Lactobacillaceae bacterium]|jgi:DNA repair exonuclease SbcCD nuclease subunit|nr:DNA repair exonuclease [Lactobacillaceae bacterium]